MAMQTRQKFELVWRRNENRTLLGGGTLLSALAKFYYLKHWLAENEFFDEGNV